MKSIGLVLIAMVLGVIVAAMAVRNYFPEFKKDSSCCCPACQIK